jgi:hypothetical protein
MGRCGLDSSGSGFEPVTCLCEHDFIKFWVFFNIITERVSDFQRVCYWSTGISTAWNRHEDTSEERIMQEKCTWKLAPKEGRRFCLYASRRGEYRTEYKGKIIEAFTTYLSLLLALSASQWCHFCRVSLSAMVNITTSVGYQVTNSQLAINTSTSYV